MAGHTVSSNLGTLQLANQVGRQVWLMSGSALPTMPAKNDEGLHPDMLRLLLADTDGPTFRTICSGSLQLLCMGAMAAWLLGICQLGGCWQERLLRGLCWLQSRFQRLHLPICLQQSLKAYHHAFTCVAFSASHASLQPHLPS